MSEGFSNHPEGESPAREQSPGLQMSDLLALPEPSRGLLNWMIRQRSVTLPDVTTFLGQAEDYARAVLDDLCGKGYVGQAEMRGVTQYRVRLAPKRGHALPSNLSQALDGKAEHGEEEQKHSS